MATVWFTSDWHLGHKGILKYRPQFTSNKEHDEYFIDMFRSTVRKRDTVWMLGDMAFNTEGWSSISDIKTDQTKLVLGNHDTEHVPCGIISMFMGSGDVYSLIKKYGWWLSHAPLHDSELRGKYNVHGHTHMHSVDDPRYFCVCPEQRDYRMVNLDEIKQYFDSLEV